MADQDLFDFVIIGSGFGGSVSALRLVEKGYKVLVLERGKRLADEDFADTNWKFWKYLWNPALRSFGILQISVLNGMLVLHGSGVGGGSLGYANVLMEPSEEMFAAPAWSDLADWKNILRPHYDAAKHMLGVTTNPHTHPADKVLQAVAEEMARGDLCQATQVGVFFGQPGQEGQEIPDPFFGGEGLARNACILCGGCMIGCRENAKNTLPKNYLHLAEKWGAEIRAEAQVTDIQPLPDGQFDMARYQVNYRSSTALFNAPESSVRARNVVVSAGTLGTLKLLFHCRDTTGTLPQLSQRLGDMVRTNSEALLGSSARGDEVDYSKGVAITSVYQADEVTNIEPVRYPAGSSLMRLLSAPMFNADSGNFLVRLANAVWQAIAHPIDFMRSMVLPKWAERTTILLVMQTLDNHIKVRFGRSLWTLFQQGLVAEEVYAIPPRIKVGHQVTRAFAEKTNGVAAGSISESLFGLPLTAHILGGVPIGHTAEDGVVDLDCQVFNYPGLYVVDGSIMPANPGINPSLTITALAEYAMSRMPSKPGATVREPIGTEK